MDNLPAEILIEILAWSLLDKSSKLAIICVSRVWRDVGLPIIHRDLEFRSQDQMRLFLQRCTLAARPRSIDITLSGASIRPDSQIFATIGAVWQKCCSERLRRINLCLNSHSLDPYRALIGDAMRLINPHYFMWIGPDPPHNFSTAIVPAATNQLCYGLARWTDICSLHLSHIAFPKERHERDFASALLCHAHPRLRHITLSQAVFLSPNVVADIAIHLTSLRNFELIDCYLDSIWGPRLRLGDVEASVEGAEEVQRIREVVICEAKLERIMGGDRWNAAS